LFVRDFEAKRTPRIRRICLFCARWRNTFCFLWAQNAVLIPVRVTKKDDVRTCSDVVFFAYPFRGSEACKMQTTLKILILFHASCPFGGKPPNVSIAANGGVPYGSPFAAELATIIQTPPASRQTTQNTPSHSPAPTTFSPPRAWRPGRRSWLLSWTEERASGWR